MTGEQRHEATGEQRHEVTGERLSRGTSGDQLDPEGPVVVAIGGGHGLARSLGAARRYAKSITAVVSVADDGGSSGRLRESLEMPAPGDVRRCLAALTPRPSMLADALEYRFGSGQLEGHAVGNLLLAALDATCGDFIRATAEAGRLLGALGTVLPAVSTPVELVATSDEGELRGQVRIMSSSSIRHVRLEPSGVAAPSEVVTAIESADQIVIGPGSLYTSVLAAIAPEGVAAAIASARGRRVYVCNLREQVPETSGYDVADHVAALVEHGVEFDTVLYDPTSIELGSVPRGY